MKKRGNISLHTSQRNEEICRIFKNCIGNPDCRNITDIFKVVARQPASRFFVSEERALQIISQKRTSGRWPINSPTRLRLFKDLEKIVNKIIARTPDISLNDAVWEAVNSPAPSLYLTPGSCRTIIYANITPHS